MTDERITVTGWIGQDPEVRTTPSGDVVVGFSIAHTTRVQNTEGDWVNGATTWYDVEAWKRLGTNAAASLRKGHPVVVHGVLRTREWQSKDGQTQRRTTLRAYALGHDLNLGVSSFNRPAARAGAASAPPAQASAAPAQVAQQPPAAAAPVALTALAPAPPAPAVQIPVREPAPAGWHGGYGIEEETPF